jgi:hypothetical protein
MAVVIVPPDGESFDETATEIKVQCEGVGEYLVLTQTWCDGLKGVAIQPEEWPAIRAAVDEMIGRLRD